MDKKMNIKKIAFIGMMGALSTVLMMIEFPLPIAPAFMKFDISDLPALFAGFFMGPISGCLVVVVKVALKLLTRGTDTVYVGELMNLFGSVCFILPAAIFYKFKHTKKGAILAMSLSTVFVSVVYIFINALVTFPLYSKLYGLPMKVIVEMGTAINPMIKDVTTLMLFSIFPFNLVKHGVTSMVTYLIYKRVGKTLRSIINE